MRGAVITREKDHGVEGEVVADCAESGTIQPVWPHPLNLQQHMRRDQGYQARLSFLSSCAGVRPENCSLKRAGVNLVSHVAHGSMGPK